MYICLRNRDLGWFPKLPVCLYRGAIVLHNVVWGGHRNANGLVYSLRRTLRFLLICRQNVDRIELRFGGWSHYGIFRAWLTFEYTLLNSRCFLAVDWCGSSCAFADKPYIELSLNSVGGLTMGLPRTDGPYQDWLTLDNTLLSPSSVFPSLFPSHYLKISRSSQNVLCGNI